MKKVFILSLSLCFSSGLLHAQGLKGLIKKVSTNDTTNSATSTNGPRKGVLGQILGGESSVKGSLTNEEIIKGLKEALAVGTQNGTNKLSATDGFFKDAIVKILLPAEAYNVERTLRNLGMGKQVDNAVLSMNRAAEDAAKGAVPIFLGAIKNMSIQDGLRILKGGDLAATDFLKTKTMDSLTAAFRPVIEKSLQKVGATKHWNAIFTNYNKVSAEKVNPDLAAHVTEKAIVAVFYQIGEEEKKIRRDPAARVTDILKKVFSNQ